MNADALHPRHVAPRLLEALADSPVVLVHGPRQCGKTTLCRSVGEPLGYTYLNFDEAPLRAAAVADPIGFVADLPERAILDEVQQVPNLFAALKTVVDQRRAPGRFLLTGSTSVLLLPRLAESLAGRMEILRLHPLAQCERAGRASGFLAALLAGALPAGRHARLGAELADILAAGGFPAALARATPRRRAVWYRDYLETLVQRDAREIARIRSLDVLPRLLVLAAGQTGQLLNVSELAAPFQVSRPTIREYVTLLQRLFLLEELPPWHANGLRRLVKTPKLHLCDTGLAATLLGLDAPALYRDRPFFGQLIETFVFQELRRLGSWHGDDIRFSHFRDKDGVEVDIVLECGARGLAGIEVKAAASVTAADFRGLRRLREAAADSPFTGAVLYDGEFALGFGPGLFAVPIRALWETP